MYDKRNGMLTRAGAELAIAQGGSVVYNGTLYTTKEQLPEAFEPLDVKREDSPIPLPVQAVERSQEETDAQNKQLADAIAQGVAQALATVVPQAIAQGIAAAQVQQPQQVQQPEQAVQPDPADTSVQPTGVDQADQAEPTTDAKKAGK